MIVIGFLMLVSLTFLIIGQIKNAEIILSPIVGIMFGFLYNKQKYKEDQEITLQCLLGIICITVIWRSPLDG